MINELTHSRIVDVIKYRWVWLVFSMILIIPGIIAMIYSAITYPDHYPLRVGIDFTGGTIIQYNVKDEVSNDKIDILRKNLSKAGIENPIIQVIKSSALSDVSKKGTNDLVSIRTNFIDEKNTTDLNKITNQVKAIFSQSELAQVNSIGSTLGKELFKKSMYALILAFIGIIAYLTIRFQFDFALIALLSLFHDALFVIGAFSILGIFFGVQIDALFITAILTVIGFSVHDTIVVFDRIRENLKYFAKKASFDEIVNSSVNQTLARSINTSLTTIITLSALYIFGGVTTREFVLAMLLGIIIGTYSSIFFASMLLAWHRDIAENKKGIKK